VLPRSHAVIIPSNTDPHDARAHIRVSVVVTGPPAPSHVQVIDVEQDARIVPSGEQFALVCVYTSVNDDSPLASVPQCVR
jgi:hypothetical protein